MTTKQATRAKSTIRQPRPETCEGFEIKKFGFGKDEHYDIDWIQQDALATDIAIGPTSEIWGINDQVIWMFDREQQKSQPVESKIVDPVDIDVAPDGSIWICTKQGEIWQRNQD